MDANDKPLIAIATGDPAGIGPEISMKAALAVGGLCRPILVGDPSIITKHAKACGIAAPIDAVARVRDAKFGA